MSRGYFVEKFYTCNEVAEMFRVKVITVWEWIRLGKLEATNTGSENKPYYRVSEKQLKKFINR